jgi:hypothetical protein
MGVFDRHAAKLASSAVSVAVAKERGYVSAAEKKMLQRYGFSGAQRDVLNLCDAVLVIPLHNVLGERAGVQMRPDVARALNGKPCKYESQFGLKMMIDVPPRVRPHLGDPTRALFVTESPIKADAMVSAGLDAIDFLGVWNWRGTNDDGGKTALVDWEYVALEGRQIYVVFDSDAMLKKEVHGAMARLGSLLKHRKAHVAYVYLPHDIGNGIQKVGVDDYLAAGHTRDDVIALATSELRKPPAEPAPPTEPEDTFDDIPDEPGHRVLDDIAEFFDRFIVWQSEAERDAVVLWIAHTHFIDILDITPRLALLSPLKQCGKTRVLELAKRLARRARHQVSMSASFMFRLIEIATPTLLIDEVDTVFGSKNKDEAAESLRGLIDGGFERGNTVGRMVGEGIGMQPKEFPTFCPVALAGIGDCIPDTIIDRSIVVRMRRRGPGETVEPFRQRRVSGQAGRLHRRLGAWAKKFGSTVENIIMEDPELPDGIEDRTADAWEPIIAIANAARGEWPVRAIEACETLTSKRRSGGPAAGVQLLTDVHGIIEGTDAIFTATLLEKLNNLDESPWGAWGKHEKGLQARDLADLLRPFDIESQNVRIGELQRKGYKAEHFADAFSRYLPPPDTPRTGRTVPPSQSHLRPQETASDQGKHARDGGTANSKGGKGDGNVDRPTYPVGVCELCGYPMTIIDEGQTAHPTCLETGGNW